MNSLVDYIDINETHFRVACLCTILAPTIWNFLSRLEYYTHFLTKIAGGNKYVGCYMLALWIFGFSLFRDYQFKLAVEAQPQWELLSHMGIQLFGYALIGMGSVFVLSSMYQLGITGTYLGDYFGILMDSKVVSFPFNVLDDPMYDGASMCFLGQALIAKSPVGLFLTGLVYTCYRIALRFEGPFTAHIYEEKERREREAKKPSKKTE